MNKIKNKVFTVAEKTNKILKPLIISASRATDIPAFFINNFVDDFEKGYCIWKNPFNNTTNYVSFENTKVIVFWTKNAEPFLNYFSYFENKKVNYYFQYTLNDYEDLGFEPNLPSLKKRIETFIKLSNEICKNSVIWRFDPLILTDKCNVNQLISKIENIGNILIKYTNKLVFSFVDIKKYKKVEKKSTLYNFYEFNEIQKIEFANQLNKLYLNWLNINPDFKISTCAEDIDLEEFNISHNSCVDLQFIKQTFSNDEKLVDFINNEKLNKDNGQRKYCECFKSKDIGKYNSCNYKCFYCYATF